MIAWQDFTPWASLAGGMLIGASAAVLITLLGRVAGISGIVGSHSSMANHRARTAEEVNGVIRPTTLRSGWLSRAPTMKKKEYWIMPR